MYFFGSAGLIPMEWEMCSARYFSPFSASYIPGAGVMYFLGSAGLMPMEWDILSARYFSDFSAW